METLRELRQSSGVARCVSCGKCTSLCPLGTRRGFSARRIAGQEIEEELAGRGVGVGRCLTCASCETRCPEGVQFTKFVRGIRERMPPEARRQPPHDGVFQSVARSMTGDRNPDRQPEWLGDGLEVAETGEVALFVGCLPFFDLYFRDLAVDTLEIARSAVKLLNEAGIRPVIVPEERCCGHDLLWGGDREGFEALARGNAASFAERGVKRIVTTCAECCRTLRLDYPETVPGFRTTVEHISEFLAGQVKAGKLSFGTTEPETLTFQDPCRLGRHLDVTQAPREVLGAIPDATVVEMKRSGRDAQCCGTSGFIHCDQASKDLQRQRLEEAADTGAATLVTACPKCLIHFRCAQEDEARRGGEKNLQVQDFTVLAARSLRHHPDEESPADDRRETGEGR